ncbi:tyrosine-type recombinase/integrase [Tsukamurella pseudospumae]|uniref:tyrosine-type recombinase/integrase n=1 Tax=Tsukamurella pseudospumae TaxID=239498 RepID=UPI001586CF71|nr:site-specific integrase [Tsukamurella pseudospumae]
MARNIQEKDLVAKLSTMTHETTISPLGNRLIAKSNTNLGTFLDSWVLESSNSNTRKLRQNLRDNCEPIAGTLLINFTHNDIVLWANGLRSGVTKSGNSLAESTIRTHMRMLKGAFNTAVERDLLPKELHPMAGMKQKRSNGRAISPSEIPTSEEVRAFKNAMRASDDARFAHNYDLELMVTIAATAGLRISEIAGLRITSIDRSAGRIMVMEQADGTNPWSWAPPKNGTSREVPLPNEVVEKCLEHARVNNRGPRDPLFQTTNGAMWSPSHANQARRRRRVPFAWHSLRHYYASTLIHNGIDVPTVSSLLGHSTTQITLDVYTHILPGAMTRAREAITTAASINGLV